MKKSKELSKELTDFIKYQLADVNYRNESNIVTMKLCAGEYNEERAHSYRLDLGDYKKALKREIENNL